MITIKEYNSAPGIKISFTSQSADRISSAPET